MRIACELCDTVSCDGGDIADRLVQDCRERCLRGWRRRRWHGHLSDLVESLFELCFEAYNVALERVNALAFFLPLILEVVDTRGKSFLGA